MKRVSAGVSVRDREIGGGRKREEAVREIGHQKCPLIFTSSTTRPLFLGHSTGRFPFLDLASTPAKRKVHRVSNEVREKQSS